MIVEEGEMDIDRSEENVYNSADERSGQGYLQLQVRKAPSKSPQQAYEARSNNAKQVVYPQL